MHQVAGRDHALRGDVGDDVARRVGPAQEEQVDLPAAAVDDEPTVEGHRRQRHARGRHLLQVRLEPLDVRPRAARSDSSLLASSLARRSAICFGRPSSDSLQPRHAELLQPLARLHRGDHLDVRAEDLGVGLVAHGVVAVEVAVDHVPDGELGDLVADLPDQGLRGRGLRVGVHDQDVVAIDDDRRVAVQHGGRLGDRAVDAVGDLLEVEEPGRGGAARGRMAVVGERPDESPQGKPLAAATSPAASVASGPGAGWVGTTRPDGGATEALIDLIDQPGDRDGAGGNDGRGGRVILPDTWGPSGWERGSTAIAGSPRPRLINTRPVVPAQPRAPRQRASSVSDGPGTSRSRPRPRRDRSPGTRGPGSSPLRSRTSSDS